MISDKKTKSPKALPVILIILFACICMVTANCSDDASKSGSKEITAFSFLSNDNSGLPEDFSGTIANTDITVILTAGSTVTALVPHITITGTSVSPASGSAQDFTNPVTYTVSAEDGTSSAYTVTVLAVKYRTFVTSSQYDGALKTAGSSANGIAGADALCMSDDNYPGNGIFKALLVDGTNRTGCTSANCGTSGISEHVDWVLKPNTTYYRIDSSTVVMTTNSNGIYNFGTLTNSFDDSSTFLYWTGLNTDWTTFSSHCGTWNNNDIYPSQGSVAGSDQTSEFSISWGVTDCNITMYLLCVEQ